MTQFDLASAHAVLEKLEALEQSADILSSETLVSAAQWTEAIRKKVEFLADQQHSVVFVGGIGVGKSSLVNVAANLVVGSSPTDKASLKSNSVLAIGSGRTTLCEVCIRQTTRRNEIGLVIEPLSNADMQRELEIYAADEWRRAYPESGRVDEDDGDPASQEMQRAIRRMTNFPERHDAYVEDGVKKRRTPLDEAISAFSSQAEFVAHFLERANLNSRTATEWWWDSTASDSLKKLKAQFELVNQGAEPSAMLPSKMTVLVADPLPGKNSDLDLTLIDTRGLDGAVESRSDLQHFLRDSRAAIVLCSTFNDAPAENVRAVLRLMAGDVELRQSASHVLLVLLDKDDASQVNGANDDRELGQKIKISECQTALESAGFPNVIDKSQIFAFDVLKDDRAQLIGKIENRISSIRETLQEQLAKQLEDVQRFLSSVSNKQRPELIEIVDKEIRDTMAQHIPLGSPLKDPLEGLYDAIVKARYASVVNATCRRRGTYVNLNLYSAVKTEASRAATVWLDSLVRAVDERLEKIVKDPALQLVLDHINLRREQFQEGQVQVVRRYAERVSKEVQTALEPDAIWNVCSSEWGRGGGFKVSVLEHLKGWSQQQKSLTAHKKTSIKKRIPLFNEVVKPIQAPQFSIYVRNLRALRAVEWTPPQLALLIGANGAGKTTLFQVMLFLRTAYERGLTAAVSSIFGGSSNLRSWDAPDEEPIEIGVDIGNVKWRIQLLTRDGSVDSLANEYLMERDVEIFSRNSLGAFNYGGEQIQSVLHLGIRTLIDRGAHEPALRSMAAFFQHVSVFRDPDIWSLRSKGSSTSDDRTLHSRGLNALTVLRRWHQDRTNRFRYTFVVDGLKAAFPNTVEDIDFVEAGTTIAARVYKPGRELPGPLSEEANGVIQFIVLCCDVASAEPGSVVAIDEPENSLHPYALRVFFRRISSWADQNNLTLLLATHSIVLLDEVNANPEQVFVMKPGELSNTLPTRLDKLCDKEWLRSFRLGELYEQGEIGSNEDGV